MNGFYEPPSDQYTPGDIFDELPFPVLKFPLSFFRVNHDRSGRPAGVQHLTGQEQRPKEGDSPKGTLLFKKAMLLSHGCEIENQERKNNQERRHFLAAPIERLDNRYSERMVRRVREGNQPNKFYLPASKDYLSSQEHFVDLRRVTPINIPYFRDARRLCGLSETAQRALHSQLGVFFSGLALYVQPISCPECGVEIDPSTFLVPSGEEEEDG